ncbi:hypothetical protein PR202_ga15953 [Eleusine coracana subsp. coracana]|uniref:KIB1-4 beta-propeller domain-containing protein n=1 Tax=Eleusine coracana subsp. coracana TaxID=191504 RepID=A0AAV5CLS9_ELECO|nr:hypothetical protein PR202_ga15953 [Eleusine coracana subsp. coracana]
MDNPPLPLDPSLAPVLLFDCGSGGVKPDEATDDARLVYSIPKKKLLLARGLGSFIEHVSWITPQGWVLTLDPASRDVSLRDPFTSRIVHLPPDPDGLLATSKDTRCVMSTTQPTDPACVVLVIHRQEPVLCHCSPGESQWSRHEYQPELLVDGDLDPNDREEIIEAVVRLVAVGGRFYTYLGWAGTGKMVTFEISRNPSLFSSHTVDSPPHPAKCPCIKCCDIPSGMTRTVYRRTLDEPSYNSIYILTSPDIYYIMYCLVESCGELFMVQFYLSLLCTERTLRFQVHRLDLRRNAWVKVTRLGINRAFLISCDHISYSLFGASMLADKFGLKANCICFSNNDDKGFYVQDMERATTTLLDPGPEITDAMMPILLMHVV